MNTLNGLRRKHSQFRSDLKKLKGTVALITSVREFFREQVTVEQAEEEIKRALENRSERFLDLVRTQVYERPSSPYIKLLRLARCEFADLEANVRRRGLEKTLEQLAGERVYFTSDEYKGKKEVVRGRESFNVTPKDFEPPGSAPELVTQSSGTTNRPTRTAVQLAGLRPRVLSTAVFFSAHDLFSYSHALYDGILPVGSVKHLLVNAKIGKVTDRWFARAVPVNSWLESRYHQLATYAIVLAGRLYGPGFPWPEFTDIKDIHRIVRWVDKRRREGTRCYITTVASSATRIARVASEMGISLEGTVLNVAGEPLTEAKAGVIRQVGASITSRYSYGGAITVGHGCANPLYRDEVHVNQHTLSIIQQPAPISAGGTPIHPILLTTLDRSAPRFLLNVENGDYSTLERRNCGCALEKAGLTLHLHGIRSFEKFTSEGMNYFYGDLFELFEKTLPSEFGGGPGDYQLVEEEDANGQTRLTLVVHPEVGKLDEERVLARLRLAFSNGSRGNRFMTGVWENAGTFRVKRQMPYASPRGKILPLHISQAKTKLLNKGTLPPN